ncbi:5-amino-6-(5-phosphoribosylamino)uracil reductase [Marmoricola sp. URHA0025 HA25]
MSRPYTLLSCCMSLDGYLDDTSPRRLILSGRADLDRVDDVRAGADAILVGAGTIRSDNPRLMVRDPARIARRVAQGRTPTPLKVTVTALAKLDPGADFFTTGDVDKLVYCAQETAEEARETLGGVATVVECDQRICLADVLSDLHARGVRRLLVEGGATVLSQLLAAGLADELQLAVAPFFVGDSAAPRLVEDGSYPWNAGRRAKLAGTRVLDDVVLLRYAASDRFAASGSFEDEPWGDADV